MAPILVLWVLFAALTLIPPVLMKWGPALAHRCDEVRKVRHATGNRTRRLRNPV
jgi:hypothetical protein